MVRCILGIMVLVVLLGCGGGDNPEKFMTEGLSHFQQHNYDAAIASFQQAIKLEPRAAAAYNMLGMSYRFKYNQLRDPALREKEIAAFAQAVEIDPKFWVAMINLGTTYYAQGKKAEAAQWFKKALTLNPDHPEKGQLEKMIAEGEKSG